MYTPGCNFSKSCVDVCHCATYHERPGTLGIDRFAPCNSSTTHGPSVVGSLETDDILFARSLSGQFDTCFDSFTARVPEEELIETGVGHSGKQFVNELKVRR